MELQGKRALITGGTAGIGLACARLFAREGATVTICGRDADRGRKAAEGVGEFIQADLADLRSVQSLIAQAGDTDILVNNAALFPGAPTVEQDIESLERTFAVNVIGTYLLTQGLVTGMLAGGHGSIINVTSLVASKGVPGASVYSASKAAVESLTRTWATEFAAHGVRVNSVAPGPTRTEGVAAVWGDTNEDLGRGLPMGRTAAPEEIAEAVLYLASPRSSFVTGALLHVDGGGAAT
ncbi:MAG: SDR family oxidoreductase [Mycobacterium sp.]